MNIEFLTQQDLDRSLKGFITQQDLDKSLNDLEKRLRNDIRKDINEDFENKMRHILTEELPIILSQKFVTKDALREAVLGL